MPTKIYPCGNTEPPFTKMGHGNGLCTGPCTPWASTAQLPDCKDVRLTGVLVGGARLVLGCTKLVQRSYGFLTNLLYIYTNCDRFQRGRFEREREENSDRSEASPRVHRKVVIPVPQLHNWDGCKLHS